MLKRLIIIGVLLVLAGFAASFLSQQEGLTILEWQGWRIEAPTSLLVIIALGVIWLVVMLDRIIGMITGLPGRISGSMSDRRQRQGHQALAIGLVAASAGDGREAIRQSKKARRLMGDAPLTDLLSAQAAALTGDPDAASRYFDTLSDQRETAFFGKAGLMRLESERGDDEAALKAGRDAFALNQKAPNLAKALFALEARFEHWQEAMDALKIAERDPTMDKKYIKASYAALYHQQAKEIEADGGAPAAILARLNKGLKHDPGFVPSAIMAARCHLEMGKTKKAQSVLEAGFKATPHPQIVTLLFDVKGGDEKAVSSLIKLADQSGNHPDALMLVARLAFGLNLWGEAKRLLDLVAEDARDLRYWQIYADLAEHAPIDKTQDQDDWPDRNHALTMATTSKRPSSWQCSSCKTISEDWQAHCADCGHFASIEWR